jgi:hypothetical protein
MNHLKRFLLRKCKHISFIFFLQLSVVAAFSQVKISGKVTGADGAGIPLVSVQIQNTTQGAITDAAGNYELFTSLKEGTYTIEFSGIGLKSVTQILKITNEKSYSVNASLVQDVMNMDEVIVTGVSAGTTRKQLGSYVR